MVDSPRGLRVKESLRLKSIRHTMARAMKTSIETGALSQISREIDVTPLTTLHQQFQPPLSLNTLLMAAVARTLPAHPLLNAELVGRDILLYQDINLGMAVAAADGLLVPVIHQADKLSLPALKEAITNVASRARSGQLTTADVEGGTFTVSNLGMFGVDSGFPIPRPPEGAILLIGAARPKPAVVEGQVAVRDIAWFSLTFDHRFIDGAAAAAFLQDLSGLIAAPHSMSE